ncbi:MAG: RelA/SpoT domain-containing protein [Candidatus Sumerlaeia bacterium]|nr:RelA/SpoT domain-containing protein [Candidatus Sumerlaeia bacterium]
MLIIAKQSKTQIDEAGLILRNKSSHTEVQIAHARNTLKDLRGFHIYPLNTFQALLRKRVKLLDSQGIVVQRLKREQSIIDKLNRFPTMRLSKMQDIGGLRAILDTEEKVLLLRDQYIKSKFPHKLMKQNDYIMEPKDDGYRGIHLIYEYHNSKAPLYNGIQLELQLRTKLQHYWATAVEIVATYFVGENLKQGRASQEWKQFFLLTSKAIMLMEGANSSANSTNTDSESIKTELLSLDYQFGFLAKLDQIKSATDLIGSQNKQAVLNLVILNHENSLTQIFSYIKSEEDIAMEDYGKAEAKISSGMEMDAVLVRTDSIELLKKAYPNYFSNISNFRNLIREFISQPEV